ncbi:hypothetical protein BD626DRAFT_573143 [Schizophyllum amplum]|uniref:Uncharacterized protein n=1 Tax=Schizophyllum amplum TaxID=97359 RepID=A0A550C253_9AGAR|nr:hypothetical protein BD626DRAFT_573143 [Auriculariopsis ampla]
MPPSSPTRQDVDLVLPLPPPTTPGDDTCRNILVVLDIAGGSDVVSVTGREVAPAAGHGMRETRARPKAAHRGGAQRRHNSRLGCTGLGDEAGGRDSAGEGQTARPKAAQTGGAVARQCHRDRCFEDVASQLCIDEVVFDAFVVKSAVEGALHHDEYTDRRPASEAMSICIDFPRET